MKAKLLPLLLAACLALPAAAHDDATLDRMPAPHGGQLRMAGPLHLEAVLARDHVENREGAVLVYLTDHAGSAVPSAGATARATLLAGGRRSDVVLVPDGDNRLKGRARYASTPDLKLVVSVTLPGQRPEQARFTPLAAGISQAAAAHAH